MAAFTTVPRRSAATLDGLSVLFLLVGTPLAAAEKGGGGEGGGAVAAGVTTAAPRGVLDPHNLSSMVAYAVNIVVYRCSQTSHRGTLRHCEQEALSVLALHLRSYLVRCNAIIQILSATSMFYRVLSPFLTLSYRARRASKGM